MSETASNVIEFPKAAKPKGYHGVEKLKRMFRESEEAQQTQRRLSFRDRDYYDNFDDSQWTEEEKRKLRSRKQQIVTSNKIRKKINGVLGYEQKARSDPRAWPNRPDQEKAADIATDVLDYIENNVRMDKKASKAAKDLAIGGIEAAHLTIGQDGDGIEFDCISYDHFFYDPRSLEEDFSDARYMGFAEWMDLDVAKALYPDAEDMLATQMESPIGGYDDGFEDKPWGVYADHHNQRVRVVVCYYQKPDDEWCVSHFTAAGVLYEGVSPWPDEDGKPACGIIAQSLYVDRKGQRYGMVRDDVSTQDEINQRKSRSVHALTDNRTWGISGWTKDENRAKEAAARMDGHMDVDMPRGQGWDFLDNMPEFAGNLELLQQALADMEVQGIYSPGDSGRAQDQSGRAILALQNAGLTAENSFFDAHNDWKLRIYRRFWSMAQKFWTEEKAVRVTGDNEAPRFVLLNQPLGYGADGYPVIGNPISQIDVDITIEAGPDTMLLQQEQFEQLVNILPQLAQLPPPMAVMIIEASQLRNKKQIIEALNDMYAQAGQVDPMAQAEREAKINETNAKAQKTGAETQKTQVETAKLFAEGMAPQPQQGRMQ